MLRRIVFKVEDDLLVRVNVSQGARGFPLDHEVFVSDLFQQHFDFGQVDFVLESAVRVNDFAPNALVFCFGFGVFPD